MRTMAFMLLLVFVFLVPWEDVYNLQGLGTLVKLIGFALLALWVATVITTGRFRKPNPFHLVAALYVLWNAVSIFWSADVDQTITRLVTFIQLFAMTYILWDLLTTRASLLAVLQMYILGAFVAIGITLYNYFSGVTFYYQRFSATATNPDDLGAVLALGLPVAWYLALSKRTTTMNHLLKIINFTYIPAALWGIALSATRSALIAALPGMAFGLASLIRIGTWTRIVLFLFLIASIFILLPLIPEASLQRLGTTSEEITEGDLNGRVEIWQAGLTSFKQHPLIGVGSNMFRSVNSVHVMSHTAIGRTVSSVGKVAHNSFLSVLVETGLIGFALFGIMIIIPVIKAWGQPMWDSIFWLTVLATWAVSASVLTWEHKKPTWLFLSLVIVSAALTHHHEEVLSLIRYRKRKALSPLTQQNIPS